MLLRFAFGTTAVVQDVVSGAFVVRHAETLHGSILYWPLKAREAKAIVAQWEGA